MKILITKGFQKEFLSVFRFERFLIDFVDIIQKKEHTLIDIHIPYRKFRYMIGGIAIRGIVYMSWETCIPLLIAKKSDKESGYNIVWDRGFEKTIEHRLRVCVEEIETGEYTVY